MSSLGKEQVAAAITAKGDQIRALKAAKAEPALVKQHVDELLALKAQYQELNDGQPFDPPKPAASSDKRNDKAKAQEMKEGNPNPTPDPNPNPNPTEPTKSKKELNKEKKKAAKKEAAKSSNPNPNSNATPATVAAATTCTPGTGSSTTASAYTITYPSTKPPLLSLAVVSYLRLEDVVFVEESSLPTYLPTLAFASSSDQLIGDFAIARFLAHDKPSLLPRPEAALARAQVEQWMDVILMAITCRDYSDILQPVENYLATRTYMVGYGVTLADLCTYVYLSSCISLSLPSMEWPNLSRHCALMASFVTLTPPSQSTDERSATDTEICPPLEGGVVGKVVTRFPPEPSGYLHIGHCKAVLLNNYYARRYNGKLIVRFDDTNPSKEKEEFEENITTDLATLDVHADVVSHTSDFFEVIFDYAKILINDGLAFMDDTPQDKMQEERMKLIDSYRRDTLPAENLALFQQLWEGQEQARAFCLRAKIDMKSDNGTMRDPVIYRFNDTPHHQTGTKYKAYPTYDFACPIVDSLEGVTHAMRTTEYNDRDEQYRWLQSALGLRPVKIHAFARMNFQYTLLSKRKLAWFVDSGAVDGWNDPRFPTIQGVVRRGIAIPALKRYILSQGASRRITNMEWDSFWALNKQHYEPTSPRFMALFKHSAVRLTIVDGPEEVVAVSIPLHPKSPELGDRVIRRYKHVLIEGPDAITLSDGEEVTLLRWGNVILRTIERGPNGEVLSMEGVLNSGGDFRKTKKLTWLADIDDLVPLKMVEFDHLITKEKLEEGEDFTQFINPHSRAETAGIGDPCLRNISQGDVIQLERRGFFRCDQIYLNPSKPLVLFMIPDGKARSMSTLSGALGHR